MALSPKERLLSALYVEYQAPVSDFDKITFEFLEMDYEVFADSLRKLAVEELVRELSGYRQRVGFRLLIANTYI